MKILKNYKSSIILLLSVLVGGIIGLIMGKDASIFAPLGNIFLNLIFTILIPMVFFNISSAVAGLGSNKILGRMLLVSIIVYSTTVLIAGVLSISAFKIFNPTQGIDTASFIKLIPAEGIEVKEIGGVLEKIVSSITVNDFSQIISRSNLLALVIFSGIVGFATMQAKEEGRIFKEFLVSGAVVCNKVIKIIMYYAPIGLAAYFANVVGKLGGQILNGYLKVFLLYAGLAIFYFTVFFTLYSFIAGRKSGVKSFWKNAAGPSTTALATCSSAACIPINIEAAKKMGVPSVLANIIMPIGINIHKDGSTMGGIFKTMFLFSIYGREMNSIETLGAILLVGLLIGVSNGAVPVGGSIGEMLILSIFGFPPEALAIVLVLATIVDAPTTLINSAGNTVCTMVIAKFTQTKSNSKDIENNKESFEEVAI